MTAERCQRIVLTGGPSSGKTSLVEHYHATGHATVPEAALQIIQELTRTMGLAAQRRWRPEHVIDFQRLILQRQLELERQGVRKAAGRVYLDRYRDLGYQPVIVPVMPIALRAGWIEHLIQPASED